MGCGFDAAEDGAAEAELAVEVDAEADAVLGDVAGVVILSLRGGSAAGPKILHPGRFKRWSFHGADDLAEADMGNGVFAEEEIGGPEFPAGAAEVFEVIHTFTMAGSSRRPRVGKRAFPTRNDLNQVSIIS